MRLGDGVALLAGVHDEQGAGQLLHFLHAAQILLQLLDLAQVLDDFLLGQHIEGAVGLHGLEPRAHIEILERHVVTPKPIVLRFTQTLETLHKRLQLIRRYFERCARIVLPLGIRPFIRRGKVTAERLALSARVLKRIRGDVRRDGQFCIVDDLFAVPVLRIRDTGGTLRRRGRGRGFFGGFLIGIGDVVVLRFILRHVHAVSHRFGCGAFPAAASGQKQRRGKQQGKQLASFHTLPP